MEIRAEAPHVWEDWMSPIASVFPAKHERWCQQMVIAGLEYLKKNEDCKPRYKWHYLVFGWLVLDNDDARSLWWHMREVITEGMKYPRWTINTRAAALRTVLVIHRHGWDKYVQEKCLHPAFVDNVCLYCKKEFKDGGGGDEELGVDLRLYREDGSRDREAEAALYPSFAREESGGVAAVS